MRTRKFVWEQKHEGWRPADAPHFTPGGPTIVAHDTLEHFNNDTDFRRELLAFGAILYGRALNDSRSYAAIFAHDLGDFLYERNFDVPLSREVKSLSAVSEKLFRDMESMILRNYEIRNSIARIFQRPGVNLTVARDAIQRSLPWIRRGYRIAKRLNRGHTRHDFKEYVERLQQAVFEDHEANPPKAGDTLTIHADRKALTLELVRGHE